MPKKDSVKSAIFEVTISYELVNGERATLTQQIEDEKEAKSKYKFAASNFKPNKVLGRRLTQLDITTVRSDISTSGKLLIDE